VQGNYFGNGISTAQADVPWILTRNFFRLGPAQGLEENPATTTTWTATPSTRTDLVGPSIRVPATRSLAMCLTLAATRRGEGNLKNMSTAGNYTVG